MKKKTRGLDTPLCLLDTQTGLLKRYQRVPEPRYAGDFYQVEETHKGEVMLENVGKDAHVLERFRTNPEQFFPEDQ
jgi:hypothetical protein